MGAPAQVSVSFRHGLASVDNPRLGHPIGAPIRISLAVILAEAHKNAVLLKVDDLISFRLRPWAGAWGSFPNIHLEDERATATRLMNRTYKEHYQPFCIVAACDTIQLVSREV